MPTVFQEHGGKKRLSVGQKRGPARRHLMIPGIKGGSEEQKDLSPPSGSIGFWHV